MDVLHTAIWVSNLDASKRFYCDGIGLVQTREFTTDGTRNVFVGGESEAEIQFKYDPDRDVDPSPAGIDHLAVGVEDLQATFDYLTTERGHDVVKEPTVADATGSTIAFVTDPDGYTVELVTSE